MNHGKLGASFWLPMLSLVVWFILLVLPAGRLFSFMEAAAHGSHVAHLSRGRLEMTVRRDDFIAKSLDLAAFGAEQNIRAIYFPGYFLALLCWPHDFFYAHDRRFAYDTYQEIVGPWLCLWFYWLVGACWESIGGKRLIEWGYLLAGTSLSVVSLALAALLKFGLSAEERGEGLGPLIGLVLWSGLFALAPVAWILQRRRKLAVVTTDKES